MAAAVSHRKGYRLQGMECVDESGRRSVRAESAWRNGV